jgi:hypothetical protein
VNQKRDMSKKAAAPASKGSPKAKPDSRKVNAQQEAQGRPRIMPALWLKGMQGLISQALGFRVSRSSRGVQRVGYFEGIHTAKQHNDLRKRRAKNKVARRSRRINRLRAKH